MNQKLLLLLPISFVLGCGGDIGGISEAGYHAISVLLTVNTATSSSGLATQPTPPGALYLVPTSVVDSISAVLSGVELLRNGDNRAFFINLQPPLLSGGTFSTKLIRFLDLPKTGNGELIAGVGFGFSAAEGGTYSQVRLSAYDATIAFKDSVRVGGVLFPKGKHSVVIQSSPMLIGIPAAAITRDGPRNIEIDIVFDATASLATLGTAATSNSLQMALIFRAR